MRVVVALGGNALLRRDEPMTSDNQRANVRMACDALAPVAVEHELVISHGNGPQVGLLALQSAAYEKVPAYPLDILDAETQGMIGYLIEQELGNRLPFEKPLATLLTMIEVDPDDPAFDNPTKPIGPRYSETEAAELTAQRGWTLRQEGERWRRVVASPAPKRIFEIRQAAWLLERGAVVICAGGGGIPVMYGPGRQLVGVEAVIDKDRASALLASDLDAEALVLATDVDGVYVDWGTKDARLIARAHPDALQSLAKQFDGGSIGPKVEAACRFATETPGRFTAIGGLGDIEPMLAGTAGTLVSTEYDGVEFRQSDAKGSGAGSKLQP
jgi:carbamate kinase